jgi:hypothetical protein
LFKTVGYDYNSRKTFFDIFPLFVKGELFLSPPAPPGIIEWRLLVVL